MPSVTCALGVYPFNYQMQNANPDGAAPPSTSSNSMGGRPGSGFGNSTIAGGGVGVSRETGSRSGDASSGVGGGSVGGADVSGFNRPR